MANSVGVVVVAAGRGTRMGTAESKQYLMLQGKPIIVHTLELFQRHGLISEIVLVAGAEDLDRCRNWTEAYGLSKVKAIVAGGTERQHSVYRGLGQLSTEWVMVHDGVRPFVRPADIECCYEEAVRTGAAVLAVPVKDTIKQVDNRGSVLSTPDRRSLWAIQTPQTFRLSELLAAYEAADKDGFVGTDDSSLAERAGIEVAVVEGSYGNIKITTPDDLEYAEFTVRHKERGTGMIAVGQGFDVHQLVEGRPCIIGGVTIPYEKGLLGHSDADVLLHAISDAILGALGLGDIGRHFPDTDPAFKDADSLKLLEHVWALAKERGYRLGNVDSTIIAQKPKMAPYIPQMAEIIARALEAEPSQVNVKATTTEQLGFTGRGEGIAAQSIVCLLQNML
ncbi:2-C-methyl-D-erythritol 2,4-cyclodiphosphate synthase [Paenibacillus sp. 7124]|uniref:Bifunctional enzyme IspD/IspF n=2 Tax=Paenibacillus TaxID=44249 RepID=A0A6M1PTM3_9BACL|nr:2-C-methyl-D-erythritol 2,4-cyclodiphosphate synthase [Paenibacillus apii]NJJ42153.1 2-C-methyl-D-erythritol 2,4-cyclodiphosphate synthase [Paenibacillus apii]